MFPSATIRTCGNWAHNGQKVPNMAENDPKLTYDRIWVIRYDWKWFKTVNNKNKNKKNKKNKNNKNNKNKNKNNKNKNKNKIVRVHFHFVNIFCMKLGDHRWTRS